MQWLHSPFPLLLPCELRTTIHKVLQLTYQLLLLYSSLSHAWNDCMAKHAKAKSGNTPWAWHCLIGKYRKGSFHNTLESRREHVADAVLVSFQLRLLPENFAILLYSARICDTSCFAFWRACRRPATSSFSASTSLTSSLVRPKHQKARGIKTYQNTTENNDITLTYLQGWLSIYPRKKWSTCQKGITIGKVHTSLTRSWLISLASCLTLVQYHGHTHALDSTDPSWPACWLWADLKAQSQKTDEKSIHTDMTAVVFPIVNRHEMTRSCIYGYVRIT